MDTLNGMFGAGKINPNSPIANGGPSFPFLFTPQMQGCSRGETNTSDVVLFDDLTSSVVTGKNFYVTNESDCQTLSQSSTGATWTNPHTCTTALILSNSFVSKAKITPQMSSGCAVQSFYTWTVDSGGGLNCPGYVMMGNFNGSIRNPTNYAVVLNTSTGGANYRLSVIRAGTTVYDLADSGISKGKDVRITYDFFTTQIKFWYWNGTAWVQMGTTQTFNIHNNDSLNFILACRDTTTRTGGDTVRFKNAYFSTI